MKMFDLSPVVLSVLLSCVLSANVTYLTTEDKGRLVAVSLTEDGIADCEVHSGRTAQEMITLVPTKNVDIVSREEVETAIEECNKLHVTFTDSHLRERRALAAIYPGTKWCGIKNRASSYSDLGVHNYTDACCRHHDHCPDCVKSFASKYGLFNWSFYPRCDCACDQAFYRCLKEGGDIAADNVGTLYFNILHAMCISEQHPWTCAKWWWIICIRYTKDTSRLVKKFSHSQHF